MKFLKKSEKNCVDCGKSITFDKFCAENPSITKYSAKKLWKNPLISIHCCNCFFKRPEKPYKNRTRYYRYQSVENKAKAYNKFR